MEVFAAVGKTVMEVISTGAKTRKYSPQWEILPGICTTKKFVHSTEVFAAVGKTVMEVFAAVGKTVMEVISAVGKTVMEVISTGAKTRKYSPQWQKLGSIRRSGKNCDGSICRSGKNCDGSNLHRGKNSDVFAAVGNTTRHLYD